MVRASEIGLGTFDYNGGLEPLCAGKALGASLIDTSEILRTREFVCLEAVVGTKGIADTPLVADAGSGRRLHNYRISPALSSLKKDQSVGNSPVPLLRFSPDCDVVLCRLRLYMVVVPPR